MFLLAILPQQDQGLPQPPSGLTLSRWSVPAIERFSFTGHLWTDSFLCDRPGNNVIVRECAPGTHPRQVLINIEYDPRAQELQVSREANSGRAVYYTPAPGGGLVIASHLNLLRYAGVQIEFDPSVMPELLTYRHACAPRTLLRNVNQLAAGDRARVRHDGSRLHLERLFAYNPAEVKPTNIGGANDPRLVKLLSDTLEAATLAPNVDGAGFGTPLSGGLDSTVLTSILASQRNIKQTYSCVYPFENASTDTEHRYATTAAQSLGTQHSIHMPTMAEYLHGAIDAIHLSEQPVMHLQSVLFYLMLRDMVAPSGATVVPCGEGADGMFGGRLQRLLTVFARRPHYRWLLRAPGVSAAVKFVSRRTNRLGLLAQVSDRTTSPLASFADPNHVLWTLAVFGDKDWICNYLRCDPADLIGQRPRVMEPYMGRDLRDCTSILALLSETSETQTIWNKLGEACGVCVTYPYLDRNVSDLVYSVPWEPKLCGPKPLLRAVARLRGVDETIVSRPKASFDIDPTRWGPKGGVFEPLVALCKPVLDIEVIRSLQSGYVFRAHTLWTMLNYAIWMRLFVMGDSHQLLHNELDNEMERLGVAGVYRAKGRVSAGTRDRI